MLNLASRKVSKAKTTEVQSNIKGGSVASLNGYKLREKCKWPNSSEEPNGVDTALVLYHSQNYIVLYIKDNRWLVQTFTWLSRDFNAKIKPAHTLLLDSSFINTSVGNN